MPTDSPRDRARALLKAATPGPWRVAGRSRDGDEARIEMGEPWTRSTWLLLTEADAALIAAAPELLAALCDELDAKDAQVARLQEALRKTSDLIAANRLVLGEYMDPRYVAQVEDAARAALAETEETEP